MNLLPEIPKSQADNLPTPLPDPYPEHRKTIGLALKKAGLFNNQTPAPISSNAQEVLNRRYLMKDENGEPVEDHLSMFLRVANNIAQAEPEQNPGRKPQQDHWEKKFYEEMASLRFLPNSPTLMNAGRELQQLSACFVLPVEDSLESIFNAVRETALIHKSGGGTGFAFSRLRPQGDQVGSTGGVASGPVSFIQAFDTTTEVVKQGGTRRGANMAVLHVSHPDIVKFVESKLSGDALNNFNISVAVTNEFMEQAQLETGQGLPLVNPRNHQDSGSLNCAQLLDLISRSAWKNGDPGLIFIDRVNNLNPNPHLGPIEGTNPCVTGDTWTMTSKGPRQVQELTNKPVILKLNGLVLPASCRGFFPTGIKDLVELETREGYILKLTPDHLVMQAYGQGWREAKDLKAGDEITLNNPRGTNGPDQWPGDGGNADLAAQAAGKFDPTANSRQIPEKWEKFRSAFWKTYLGFIIDRHAETGADGSISIPVASLKDRRILQRTLLRFSAVSVAHQNCLHLSPDNAEWLNWALCQDAPKPANLEGRELTAHVKSVKPAGVGLVYDVQVPMINAFEANGICVHNCGEQPLLPYESCNLGSINLAAMTRLGETGPELSWETLSETVNTAVRFLDNVITMNRYPIPEIEQMTKRTRRIGLGVMGLADLLIQLAIPYDSPEARETAETVLSFIRRETYRASASLSAERDPYPEWQESVYRIENPQLPLRNTAPTTIAPTGTISIIAGVSSGIEPIFAPGYTRTVMDGTKLHEVHPYIRALAKHLRFDHPANHREIAESGRVPEQSEIPSWVNRLFMPAHEIPWESHIKMQAAAQRHTDNAVSKTINLPADATPEDVKDAYIQAYKSGCKGITVYRDSSRESQVLQTGDTPSQNREVPHEKLTEPQTLEPRTPEPRPRPRITGGITQKVQTGHGSMYVTINYDEKGKPFEVFSNMGKAGGCDSAQMEAVSRLISMSLRAGIDPEDILEQLTGITCCPFWDNGVRISSGPDAVAHALRHNMDKARNSEFPGTAMTIQPALIPHQQPAESRQPTARKCPDCRQMSLFLRENCLMCFNCGWSRCE